MKVNAVESNDRRRSCIVPMAQGALIGGVTGYVAKYAQPLTPQEKKNPEYIKVIKKINNQKTEFGPQTEEYLSGIRSKIQRSLAEDTFVKMFDGMKEGDHVKPGKIRSAIKKLEKQTPGELEEFKRICKDSAQIAKNTAKQCVSAYNLVTKHIRPTSFYLITGAVVGAFIALFKDILKTDVKH